MAESNQAAISSYSKYNPEAKRRKRVNPLEDVFPPLPNGKYDVIYADPPWDYGGKMQYDNSSIKAGNVNFERNVFISAANFIYPTLKLKELKQLNVNLIAADDCVLFLWTTGPQLANSIELGTAWGFEYKTMAFVWDKQVHNPGRYTLSQTEFVLVLKKGRIPSPRGARNIRQLVSEHRGKHSEKPKIVLDGITRMFPQQRKIELFARTSNAGWDNWGLEIPESKQVILSQGELDGTNTGSLQNFEQVELA